MTSKVRRKYRGQLRNNAIEWIGVETKRVEQPLLTKSVSDRGEVHYQKVKERIREEDVRLAEKSEGILLL